MKKLFFIAALGVAGMMSASASNDVNIDLVKSDEATVKADLVLIAPPEHAWIGVQTWCGKVFYLDMNHYNSQAELEAAASHFTQAQCGTRSTDIGTQTT